MFKGWNVDYEEANPRTAFSIHLLKKYDTANMYLLIIRWS